VIVAAGATSSTRTSSGADDEAEHRAGDGEESLSEGLRCGESSLQHVLRIAITGVQWPS
jgi:hypothetical protein